MTTNPNIPTTPSIVLISLIGDYLKTEAHTHEPKLDFIVSQPELPEWFIPALQVLDSRNITWGDILRALDLPDQDGRLLATEAARLGEGDRDSLIALAITEIMTNSLGQNPDANTYTKRRADSAPSIGYLALCGITWADVTARRQFIKSEVVDLPTASGQPIKTVASYLEAVGAAEESGHAKKEMIDRAIVVPPSKQPTRTSAQPENKPKKRRNVTRRTPPTLTDKQKAIDARIKAAIKSQQTAQPAGMPWMKRHPHATQSQIASIIVQLMFAHNAFAPNDYRERVTPQMGPQPSEVAKRYGSNFWFQIQDKYLKRYSLRNIPNVIAERNWRAISIDEAFTRMRTEADRLNLKSEFAYNTQRHPALAPQTGTLRILCEEAGVSYVAKRGEYFEQTYVEPVTTNARIFTTYPLAYVLNAFHDELLELKTQSAADYEKRRRISKSPSLEEVERVAARHGISGKDAYLSQFTTPAYPE